MSITPTEGDTFYVYLFEHPFVVTYWRRLRNGGEQINARCPADGSTLSISGDSVHLERHGDGWAL